MSEIMLQQTGVATVIPYFQRWMTRFPTVPELAVADEQDVLTVWQGLGYYRRCRNLLSGARLIVAEGWPVDAKAWQKVPGVGRYTAGAIASISLGEAVPVVDGNVERVYARLTADPSSGAELTRRTWTWAGRELHRASPGDWNQALMELGATVCTPASPRCSECPISGACAVFAADSVGRFPVPAPKREVVRLEFDVAIAFDGIRYGLRQIPSGEWWEGMWEFPRFAKGSLIGHTLPTHRHTVTHHRITLHPVVVEPGAVSGLTWFEEHEVASLPLPAPQRVLLTRVISRGSPSPS